MRDSTRDELALRAARSRRLNFACPTSYLSIGNGDGAAGCGLHHPGYDFNDACLATGASYWIALAERYLA
ncbi:hypothetical protein CFB82_30590 [Burkholderia sp. HI2714]|nr:hypothetical protein CFB82_30590 [Burkholderia sp. HI2714]